MISVLSLSVAPATAQTIKRVDPNGNGTDGNTWATAFTNLQDALDNVTAGQFPPDEIWVAAGTYTPDQGINHVPDDATETFALKSGVQIYGGFIGVESMRSERNPDPSTNNTILSGDLGGGNNALVIAAADGVDVFTVLDGFSITAATQHAVETFNGAQPTFSNLLIRDNQSAGSGAGMFNHDNARESIENCEFRNNTASGRAGAMYNTNNSDPIILDCVFKFNSAGGGGGAIFSENESFPQIERTAFIGNVGLNGANGGAIHQAAGFDANRRLVVRNCSFTVNQITGDGGGGALYLDQGVKPAEIINSTFLSNLSGGGGGAVFNFAFAGLNAVVVNCTFTNNSSDTTGGAIHNFGTMNITNSRFVGNVARIVGLSQGRGGAIFHEVGTLNLTNCTLHANQADAFDGGGLLSVTTANVANCVFWNNTGSGLVREEAQVFPAGAPNNVTHTCVHKLNQLAAGIGNIGEDPRFVDEIGPDGSPGTGDEDLRLTAPSACIDAGDNVPVPDDLFDVDEDFDPTEKTPDLDLAPRIENAAGVAACGVGNVDMGAYEFTADCNNNGQPDAFDIEQGTSVDVNADGIPDECQDCNNNQVLDPDDIGGGTSQDCNNNCVPDECEPDCNGNGTPDDCDISQGTELDCNNNGVPDSCEAGLGISEDCNANGIPDDCEIGCDVEIIFLVDTSFSISTELTDFCNDTVKPVVDQLVAADRLVTSSYITIAGVPPFPVCPDLVTRFTDTSVFDLFTTVNNDGVPVPGNGSCGPLRSGPFNPDDPESWAPGVAILAEHFDWTAGAVRVIVPFSDEGPCRGGLCTAVPGDSDFDATQNAIQVAVDNNVIVFPVTGLNPTDQMDVTCAIVTLQPCAMSGVSGPEKR